MNKFIAAILCCFVLCFGAVLYVDQQLRRDPGLLSVPPDSSINSSDTDPDGSTAPSRGKLPRPSTEHIPEPTPLLGGSEPLSLQPLDGSFPMDPLSGGWMSRLMIPVTDTNAYNDELQRYLADQSRVVENTLMMTADRIGVHYISGKMESTFAFCYGSFTFRIHSVSGSGLFPAVWMLPTSGEGTPEVDIYEAIGNEPDLFYGVLHYSDRGVHKRDFFDYSTSGNDSECTLRFVWTEDALTWYLNGEEVYSITENVPQEPMYLITNLAVGGKWAGEPPAETQFPATFQVEVLEFAPQYLCAR